MNAASPLFLLRAVVLAGLIPRAWGAAGDLDVSFAPNPNNNMSGSLVQPDGASVLLGNFTSVGASSHSFLARLTQAGAVDASFTASSAGGSGFTNPGVFCGAVQQDGRIVVGGLFAFVNGSPRSFIGRVLANGSLDTGYTSSSGDQIRGIAIQPDGKIVAVGYFTTMNGVSRGRVARLNTDGTLDTTFNPNASATTRSVAVQPDGKIVIGGSFTSVGGVPRNHAARVNADGTLDADFDPNVSGDVYSVAVQPDGKIIFGGTFSTAGGTARSNLARVNASGSLDTAFNPGASGNVRTSSLQTDGRILIGGEFTTAGGASRSRIARLNADGTLDASFNATANGTVFGITLQADGRIFVCGQFSTAGGAPRDNLARLLNDPATQSISVSSSSRLEWQRGGSSPETHAVTLETSTNGGAAWSAPAAGTRITGGWEFTGLTLPSSGMVRLRARTAGGYNNGTAGLVETVSVLNPPTPLQLWRQIHFGSPDNSGPGADNADPDSDGVENLAEFVFDLDPKTPDAAFLPAWQTQDDDLVLTFVKPENAAELTCTAEYNTTLDPAGWTAIPNSTLPPLYTWYAPVGISQRLFLRLKVSAP